MESFDWANVDWATWGPPLAVLLLGIVGGLVLVAIGNSPTINDAAVLEFDFIAISDTILFDFVFASDEYLEFVNTAFNDVFGFFLSGPGINGPYMVAVAQAQHQTALVPDPNDGAKAPTGFVNRTGLGSKCSLCGKAGHNKRRCRSPISSASLLLLARGAAMAANDLSKKGK